MSLGPLGGIVGSVAGAPLSQTKGASEERTARDAAATEAKDELTLRAEKSSGVGQTEGDSQSSDRDADGRRLWEQAKEHAEDPEEQPTDDGATDKGPSDDPGSENHLDLLA